MKVVFFTRYDTLGASSRYRFLNYRKYFDSELSITTYSFFNNKYLKDKYNAKNNIFNIFFCYIKRLYHIQLLSKNCVIILEKELFPYFPFFIERYFLKKNKFIVDFDDAIYLNYKTSIFKKILNTKIEKISSFASFVLVGSNSLYNYFSKYNKNIQLIPTVIDLDKYKLNNIKKADTISIVWIGTQSTSIYLLSILDILKKLKKKYKINLICIGAHIKDNDVISIKWKENEEVKLLSESHIGIMPLFDDEWCRSKCAFKLIQYMACKLPVVASDIGQNKSLVNHDVGYLVNSKEEWYSKLEYLIVNHQERKNFGKNGYTKILNEYNYDITFPKFLKVIQTIN